MKREREHVGGGEPVVRVLKDTASCGSRAEVLQGEGWDKEKRRVGVRGRSADALRNGWRVEEREGKLLTSGQQQNDETKKRAWSKVCSDKMKHTGRSAWSFSCLCLFSSTHL